MNNKGQSLGLSLLTALMFLLVSFSLLNFVTAEVATARNNLSCASASTISDGIKVLCLVLDTTVIYWVIIIFSVIIGLITARLNL